jgi:hypothetical protein
LNARAAERHAGDQDAPLTDEQVMEKIRSLPKEIGALLIVAGIGGLLLPGPIGTPFLVLGGLVLWPKGFERVDTALERRFPRMHRQSLRQIHRFISDLERRYPTVR